MSAQIIKNTLLTLVLLSTVLGLNGCASTAPVQEMSNARQTIAAAQEAQASVFAPDQLQAAEQLMQQATAALESGDYARAREYAVAAQQQAIKARQLAVSQQK